MSNLVYTCSPIPPCGKTAGYTTNDVILFRKFTEWRYGEQERIDRNEVINRLLHHVHRRSALEIWRKAEIFLQMAESKECRTYFERVVNKYRDRYIYGM